MFANYPDVDDEGFVVRHESNDRFQDVGHLSPLL